MKRTIARGRVARKQRATKQRRKTSTLKTRAALSTAFLPAAAIVEAEGAAAAPATVALTIVEDELQTLKNERERLHDTFIWAARELSGLVADGTEVNRSFKLCLFAYTL